jgi:hypothetical protein
MAIVSVELTCVMEPDDDEVAACRSDETRAMYQRAAVIVEHYGGRVDHNWHYDWGERTRYEDAYARVPMNALIHVLRAFDDSSVGYDNIDLPRGTPADLIALLHQMYPPNMGVWINT